MNTSGLARGGRAHDFDAVAVRFQRDDVLQPDPEALLRALEVDMLGGDPQEPAVAVLHGGGLHRSAAERTGADVDTLGDAEAHADELPRNSRRVTCSR